MTRKESQKLDELHELYIGLAHKHDDQGRKIDKLLETLTGDELGNYEGLISAQKKDNAFRDSVTVQLESIIKNQAEQIGINKKYHDRLTALENFANFFTTLSKIKRTTWIIIGALATGAGWIMIKLQAVMKYLGSMLDFQASS